MWAGRATRRSFSRGGDDGRARTLRGRGALRGRRMHTRSLPRTARRSRTIATAEARAALTAFCESSWPLVHAIVRAQGYRGADAEDLTQAYFARFIERGDLEYAARWQGCLRTYLRVSVRHFLSNERDRDRAKKRGGGRRPLSLDAPPGDPQRDAGARATTVTPETQLAQSQAEATIQKALDELRAEMERGGLRRAPGARRGLPARGGQHRQLRAHGRRVGRRRLGGPRDRASAAPAPRRPAAPRRGAFAAAIALPAAREATADTLPSWQVPISEPTTLLTDYLLAAVAIALGARLAAAATGSRPRQLWAVAFAIGGCAALAGGTVHGLRAWLDPLLTAWLWQCALLGSALAGALLLAGAALNGLRGGALRLALVVDRRDARGRAGPDRRQRSHSRDAVWAGAVLRRPAADTRAVTGQDGPGVARLAPARAGARRRGPRRAGSPA